MQRDLVRVAAYQSITIRCRMIRVGALMYGLWLAQNSPKTVDSYIDNVHKTRGTWPCQAKNRYDMRLANRRAPGAWFVLGFRIYLFLAPKWPGIPTFGKKNYRNIPGTWYIANTRYQVLFYAVYSSMWRPGCFLEHGGGALGTLKSPVCTCTISHHGPLSATHYISIFPSWASIPIDNWYPPAQL